MKIRIIDKDTFEVVKDDIPSGKKDLKKKISVNDKIKKMASIPDKNREKWWEV
jgi:hypothetical protein